MIIGTAGHIDHGKTTLVRALTGVDTDRLPEEKRRGISIELGYAFLPAGDSPLAFVDVPGHERLLHTMLAGATGVGHALLLVAADDGVMPQTREHLAVISLLGIEAGTVAITKIDRVDAERRAAVRADVQALLQRTPLAGAPLFEVSAVSGAGVESLRAHLLGLAAEERAADAALAFRLAVDRVFTLAGVGTVVTGTVHGGRVRPGDELQVAPGERRVRVRSVHAQNRPAAEARAGQRCALALAGVAKDELSRGDWICAPTIALDSQRVDVRLQLWHDEAAALRSGTTVHAHLGAGDVMGSVALLDRESLAPGEIALVQLVLRRPIATWHGERGVLRDASASRTVAGLQVLDPLAPARWRRTPERLQMLRAWSEQQPAERLAALLAASPLGLDAARLARCLGIDERAQPLAWPPGCVRIEDAAAPAVIGVEPLRQVQDTILQGLARLHEAQPDHVGPDLRRLKRVAGPRVPEPVWLHAVEALLAQGSVTRSGPWLHLPAHAQRLSEAEERLGQALLPALLDGGFDPPWVRDLARSVAAPDAVVRQTLASLARRGAVFQVVKDLYYPAATVDRLAALAQASAAAAGGLSAASFRDATGLGRKRAIQLLEFFDRIGYTRRVQDAHLLRPDAAAMFGATR